MTGISHEQYLEDVGIIHFLLGTALVALAIPLYRNLSRLNGNLLTFLATLVVTCVTSITIGVIAARGFGAAAATLLSIAPKSATMAVSMEIAKSIGGIPPITAFVTALTGVIGAVLG